MLGVFTSSHDGLMDRLLKCMFIDFYTSNRCIKALRLTRSYDSFVSFLLITNHVLNNDKTIRLCVLHSNANLNKVSFNSSILLGENSGYENLYINDSMEIYTQTHNDCAICFLPLCGFNYELIDDKTPQLDLSSLTKLV